MYVLLVCYMAMLYNLFQLHFGDKRVVFASSTTVFVSADVHVV